MMMSRPCRDCGRSYRISKETTYMTEPLKADGKQDDYFAAIQQAAYPANTATDENGYRLIERHLGHGVMLISLLAGTPAEEIAHAIGIAGSLEHPPTNEQLQLQSQRQPRAVSEHTLRHERREELLLMAATADGRIRAGRSAFPPLFCPHVSASYLPAGKDGAQAGRQPPWLAICVQPARRRLGEKSRGLLDGSPSVW